METNFTNNCNSLGPLREPSHDPTKCAVCPNRLNRKRVLVADGAFESAAPCMICVGNNQFAARDMDFD